MEKAIYWFRQDLRLNDNPALFNAANSRRILPLYILDNNTPDERCMGAASRWWLHHSLMSLNQSLEENLLVYRGDPVDILLKISKDLSLNTVYWNECYEPRQIKRDQNIQKTLEKHNIQVIQYNGSLLWHPTEVIKQDGTPYKIFTPYYKNGCLERKSPGSPVPQPKQILYVNHNNSTNINDLQLLSQTPWHSKLNKHWEIGEKAAHKKFNYFITNQIDGYKENRDFPSKQNTSRLSPHLHFGEISPRYIWNKIQTLQNLEYDSDNEHFCRELGWREFSYYLLYHFPNITKQNLNSKFDSFPWIQNSDALQRWQNGKTGIPIIDAGMRELWQTGYIHNRVRMITASFLVKNLLIDWRHGEEWFWDCLVDADLASNSMNWQWVAGCGVDAAPYFRIFNPVTQGQKFDADGIYTKKFVPELKNLPNKYLFNPWEAPSHILQDAGIILGKDYPKPIIDLKESRIRALEAYNSLNSSIN